MKLTGFAVVYDYCQEGGRDGFWLTPTPPSLEGSPNARLFRFVLEVPDLSIPAEVSEISEIPRTSISPAK